jgi:acetyl esterase
MRKTTMQDPHTIPGIDPQMADAMLKGRELTPSGPLDPTSASIEDVRAQYLKGRAYWNEEGPQPHKITNHTVAGPHGPIPVRFYYPTDTANAPLILFLHGGGYTLGGIESHDRICRWLAEQSGAVFASVDYHLAPEHKFPTQIEEAVAVLDWAREAAEGLGIDAARVGMGGDSAGAAIAVSAALTLKKQNRADALKFMLLYYGNYGLGNACDSAQKYKDPIFGLSEPRRKFYQQSYIPADLDPEDYRRTPLKQYLTELPPAFLGISEMDPLHDNSPALSAALTKSGIPNELKSYSGVLHGFLHMTRSVKKSRQALNDGGDAVRKVFSI